MSVSEEVSSQIADFAEKFGDGWEETVKVNLVNRSIHEIVPGLVLMRLTSSEADMVVLAAQEDLEGRNLVTHQRKELHQQIELAEQAVSRALIALGNLSELDVEYLDGHDDTEHFLKKASRTLRAAKGVKPTGRDGQVR